MRKKRAIPLSTSLGALCAAAGCTSLLGDFSTGPATGGVDEGGLQPDGNAAGDGPVAETGGGDDVSVEASGDDGAVAEAGEAGDAPADGPPGPLTCGTWAFATPVVLETLAAGTRVVQGPLTVYAIATGSGVNVRVVAGKSGPEPFSVYLLDRTATPPNVTTIGPTAAYFQSTFATVRRSPGKVNNYTVVLASTRSSSMVSATYEAYVLQDTASTVPNPFAVYQLTPVQAAPTSMHILPLATTSLFTAVENGPTTYSLGVGIATGASPITTLFPVATSPNLDDFTRSVMFHDTFNNTVYIYDENDTSTPGVSAWSLADTVPADAGAPTKRAVGALAAQVRDINENTQGMAAADIAYEEYTLNGSFISGITYRAGTIPYSGATPDIRSWQSTDLPVVKSFPGIGVFNAPFGVTNGSLWASAPGGGSTTDDIMLIGPGARNVADSGNGGVPFGLNLVWMNASGVLRSSATGADRLLPTLGDFSGVAAAPIAVPGNGKTARWAVVWSETKTGDAGQYDVISYNELICQ